MQRTSFVVPLSLGLLLFSAGNARAESVEGLWFDDGAGLLHYLSPTADGLEMKDPAGARGVVKLLRDEIDTKTYADPKSGDRITFPGGGKAWGESRDKSKHWNLSRVWEISGVWKTAKSKPVRLEPTASGLRVSHDDGKEWFDYERQKNKANDYIRPETGTTITVHNSKRATVVLQTGRVVEEYHRD